MDLSNQISKCNIIYDVLDCDIYLFDPNNVKVYSIGSDGYPPFFYNFISDEIEQFLYHIDKSNMYSGHYYNTSYFLNFIGVSFWKENTYNGSILLGPFLDHNYDPSDFTVKYSSQIRRMGGLKELSSFYNKLPVFSSNQPDKLIPLIKSFFRNPFINPETKNIKLKTNSTKPASKLNILDDFIYWEEHYNEEKLLLEAVSNGDISNAVKIIKRATLNMTSKSNKGSIKRTKDLLTLTNSTLTRIAIDKNVPLMVAYIISNSFGHLIEQASLSECNKLTIQIIKDYTNLINKYATTLSSKLISQAITVINEYSLEAITLKDISAALQVSPPHLSRQFKKEMHMTITEYIHKIKIDSSIELIKLKRYSLLEISEMVGYINYSHFNKWFNAITGYSPKQYSEKIKR